MENRFKKSTIIIYHRELKSDSRARGDNLVEGVRGKKEDRTHRKFNPTRVIFLLSILTSMLASFVLERGGGGGGGDVDDSSSSRTAENPIVSTVSRGKRRQKKGKERERERGL